ncbi:MAG: ATP-binding cassette domain-containing protein [Proteobacteria bacterium]|nr:ATP-binding cassette domain-containing protein [Pseudomonadota bacterium]
MKNNRFTEQEVRFEGKYARTVFQTLYFGYRPFFYRILFCLLLGLTGRALLLANANVIGIWVDSFCKPSAQTGSICRPLPLLFETFSTKDFLSLLLMMSLAGFLMTLVYRVLFSRLSALAVSQIYDETTFRTSRMPMSFFDQTPAGRIITRFSSDYGNVFRIFGGPLAEFLAIIFDLLCMMILITMASPYYLIVVACMMLANFILYRSKRERLRKARRDLSASRSPSIAHFAETAQGASAIRSFVKQKSFSQRFLKLDSEFLNQKLKTLGVVSRFSFEMGFLTAVLLLGTGTMAWFLLQKGLLTVGSIGVAFGFIALAGNTIQMFFDWMAQFEEALVGMERLDNYIRRPLEPGAKLPSRSLFETGHEQYTQSQELELSRLHRQIPERCSVEFSEVRFRYRPDLPWVLHGVSFSIPAGERWGIIGRTGSGKSSLIQALFRMYPLEDGCIRIDGKDQSSFDLTHYRSHIAFIAQDPVLFRGNIRENLDLENKHTDEELCEVLGRVGLGHWGTPEGLHTVIEEKGRNLSQGERQLICMARCLVHRAPVVVMDEATASVDPQSEEILVRATEEFFAERTQIIIAHRLSTLEKCHKILWLQNGHVEMIGTPQEILPVFRRFENHP